MPEETLHHGLLACGGLLTFLRLAHVNHARRAVFRIPTAARGDVYLSARASDGQSIVEVDAQRLLTLWRQPGTRLAALAYGDAHSWREDNKFADAEAGFAKGEANPVPLASVTCARWTRPGAAPATHFDFINGVTRTIWLLAHGAEVFPLVCPSRDAALLQAVAGAAGGGCVPADQLVPAYTSPQQWHAEINAELALTGLEPAGRRQGHRL